MRDREDGTGGEGEGGARVPYRRYRSAGYAHELAYYRLWTRLLTAQGGINSTGYFCGRCSMAKGQSIGLCRGVLVPCWKDCSMLYVVRQTAGLHSFRALDGEKIGLWCWQLGALIAAAGTGP